MTAIVVVRQVNASMKSECCVTVLITLGVRVIPPFVSSIMMFVVAWGVRVIPIAKRPMGSALLKTVWSAIRPIMPVVPVIRRCAMREPMAMPVWVAESMAIAVMPLPVSVWVAPARCAI